MEVFIVDIGESYTNPCYGSPDTALEMASVLVRCYHYDTNKLTHYDLKIKHKPCLYIDYMRWDELGLYFHLADMNDEEAGREWISLHESLGSLECLDILERLETHGLIKLRNKPKVSE